MTNQPVILTQTQSGPGLLVRALYFIFIGIWLGLLWVLAAWFFNLTIIGLPLGLAMLNRLPQVVTLKPQRTNVMITPGGQVVYARERQLPFVLRALYFVLIGWWFSALWIAAAWALHASIIGMLIGFWMFDRVPAIVTLARS